MPFPPLDPIALQLGPFAIRWYSLAYIAGIVLGWLYIRWINKRAPVEGLTPSVFDDMLVWGTIGIVLGGRLGYVLFYKPLYYLENPAQILHIWEGGMSFHGGMLGTILAFYLFCRKYKLNFLAMMDRIAAAAPLGLGFGRIANFINGELYGRVTDAPWGVIFPHGGPLPRHPSQLYEATLEGVFLFLILFFLVRFTRALTTPGRICGAFLIVYGASRAFVELFREPDAHLGFLFAHITMGQLLCAPMIVLGIYLLCRKRPAVDA